MTDTMAYTQSYILKIAGWRYTSTNTKPYLNLSFQIINWSHTVERFRAVERDFLCYAILPK